MEQLSKMTMEDLREWLLDKEMPMEVAESFEENDMDGEALGALIGLTPGPDCLKDLVKKVGWRLKLYKVIKELYEGENMKNYKDHHNIPESPESSLVTISRSASVISDKGSSLLSHKEGSLLLSQKPGSSSKMKAEKSVLPNPFPVPNFRSSTEANLESEVLTEPDRKYMVQTLATMLMSYVQRPSLKHCLVVSKALHGKFRFLGDETSESAWKWFIYTRAQNVNRPESEGSSAAPPKKKTKIDDPAKHTYPAIPDGVDDEESTKRNMELLKGESLKPKPRSDVMKDLLIRTFPTRRVTILNTNSSVVDTVKENPYLKKCAYVTLEFELILQKERIREEFDEELVSWSRAIIGYCKTTQKKSTAIQLVIKDANSECTESDLIVKAIRCLSLLLIPTKTKQAEGDIPYVMRFVPSGTPPMEAPDKENNQPHIVVIELDDYDQYFLAIEQTLMLESRDIATALFLLLASHYVFNLSYHSKSADFLIFVQERIAQIPSFAASSQKKRKEKSPVSVSHVNGIARIYNSMKGDMSFSNDMD